MTDRSALTFLPAAEGSGLVRRAVAGFRRLLANWAARRDVQRLAALDERTLKDIGLTPADVDGALATSLFRDPTALLVVRACERRAIERQTIRDGLRRLDLTGPVQIGEASADAARRPAPAPC